MQSQQENQCSQVGGGNPDVTLHAKARRAGTKVEWSLDFKNPPDVGSKAEVHLAKGSGAHEIVIRLIATQGLDIVFNRCDPIWVSEATQCPPPPGIDTDQITVLDCTDSKLQIRDSNARACTLTYQLNFVGTEPLDPMIRNGGT